MSDTECPTCGRTDFKNETGMKKHHAWMHDEKLGFVEKECTWCGETFERQEHELTDSDNNFCDAKCAGQHQANLPSEEQPNWKGDELLRTCDNCGENFRRPESRNRHERTFCSLECSQEYRVGEDHPRYNRVIVECHTCGEEFERVPSHARKFDRQFCSTACMAVARTGEFLGSNNPVWAGGERNYGEGWNEHKKERVRERDDHQCQGCGIEQDALVERIGRKLDIHHIKPAKHFASAQDRNSMNNLVALCPGCHNKFEGSPMRPKPDGQTTLSALL